MRKLALPLSLLVILSVCPASYGAVPVVDSGKGPHFDKARIPPALRKDFDSFEVKCSRCHTLERIASSFLTGVTSVTGRPLDFDTIKSTLLDMMRKSTKHKTKGYEISKEELKSTLALMKYFLDESVK